MPTTSATSHAGASSRQTCDLTGWLGFAASPTFAVMACIATIDASPIPLCASGPGFLPINGMTTMYLLMSLFHLSPWLKLASSQWPTRS